MASSRLPAFATLALLTVAAGALSACAHHPGYYASDPYYAPRAGYYGDDYGEYYGGYADYWYYPAVGAYYDPRISLYFYYEHDHWVRARELPPHYRPHLGRHVVVHSPHDRPYAEHHRHRDRYAPERYREERHARPAPDRRGDDIWIGKPHRQEPERDRHERRRYDDARNGNGTYRERERERYAAPVQPRIQERARILREEDARESDREIHTRRGDGDERGSIYRQPPRERAAEAERPQPRMRTQDMPRPAPDRREPPGVEIRRQQENAPPRTHGKEIAQDDARQDNDRRDKGRRKDDAESRHWPRGQDGRHDNGP